MVKKNADRWEEFTPCMRTRRTMNREARGTGGRKRSWEFEMISINLRKKRSCLLSKVTLYSVVFKKETTNEEDPVMLDYKSPLKSDFQKQRERFLNRQHASLPRNTSFQNYKRLNCIFGSQCNETLMTSHFYRLNTLVEEKIYTGEEEGEVWYICGAG